MAGAHEQAPRDEPAAGADFEQIELRCGALRFGALAAGEGPLVLCLHGFPDHAESFRGQLPALAAAGYRAVAPRLRGYEPSSQTGPRVADYHPLQLAGDVVEWAQTLSPTAPVHLVGHDWGGVLTYIACALAPQHFRSATTLAVPPFHAIEDGVRRHPVQLRNSWYMFFFQLRGLADRALAARNFALLEKLWRDWSPGWTWDAEDMARLKRAFQQPGVVPAALAYYRATLNPFLADSRRLRELARRPCPVPTLAITGARDGCMDTRIADCIRPELFPAGLRVERIDAAGHFLHQERPDSVNPLLLDWIAQH